MALRQSAWQGRGTPVFPVPTPRKSGKGHWAGDWKARMTSAARPLPSWTTLDNGLNFSGSQFPLPKTEIIELNYSKYILYFQKPFLTSSQYLKDGVGSVISHA